MWFRSKIVAPIPAQVAQSTQHQQHQGPSAGNSYFLRAGSYISAACLIIAAGSQNVSFGYDLGSSHSEFGAFVLAGASAGATLLGPVAFAAAVHAFRNWRVGEALIAVALGLGCLAYAATCSLGFVAGNRDHAISEQSHAADTRTLAKARFDDARAELATLKGSSGRILERRRELEKQMRETSGALQIQKPIAKAAVSQASAIAFYLTAAGWSVEASDVGTWLNLAMVAFLELAAGLSLTVAASLGSPHRPAAPLPTPMQPEPEKPAVESPEARREAEDVAAVRDDVTLRRGDVDRDEPPAPPQGQRPPRAKPGRPRKAEAAKVLGKLKQNGGKVQGGLTGLGKLLGTGPSKTTTWRTLNTLAAAGLIALSTGPGGTVVQLV